MKSPLFVKILLTLALVPVSPSAWCQEIASTADQAATPDSDSRMRTPPTVSGDSYPALPASEVRSNYLRGGVTFSAAYNDNQFFGSGHPVSDETYSIWPSIAFDKTVSRLHLTFNYSPGFSFYQKETSLDQANQNLGMTVQYRVSPHVAVSFRDNLLKTSNFFNQPDLANANPVSGLAQAPTVAVIAPNADMLSNSGGGAISYQFSPSSMVGASGNFSNLYYLNSSQAPGLFDSNSVGGSAFYNRRLSQKHYIGGSYSYQRYTANALGGHDLTETHTISLFYTIYFKPTLSLSFSGGPQRAEIMQPLFPASSFWSPAATASFGWQARRTALAAGYSRIVSGGGGLLGAYHANSASASVRQQISKTWSGGITGSYSIYSNALSLLIPTNSGGHTVSGTASVQHQLGQHFNVSAGYTRLHQSYNGIALISGAPDTNLETISVSYQFSRPIGR